MKGNNEIAINLLKAMMFYVTTGNALPILAQLKDDIGALALRHICISILSWLKSRSRLKSMTRMKVSEAGNLAGILKNLIVEANVFSMVFVLREDVIELHETFTDEDVNELLLLVGEMYNPPRFSTIRREKPV